jgi:hypothetical protein
VLSGGVENVLVGADEDIELSGQPRSGGASSGMDDIMDMPDMFLGSE